mgnify:CR=1 FL=1
MILRHSIPKFHASFVVTIPGHPKNVSTYEGPIPEELMDEYQKIIGDGLAKVSISVDVSMKDYGAGASSMASVTLTCGQTESQIRVAQEMAKDLAMEFAYKNANLAKEVYKSLAHGSSGAVPGKPNYK